MKKPKEIKDEELKKSVARAFDLEKGKTVLVQLTDGAIIRIDFRCMDKDTDVCFTCGLRFNCYTSQSLTIPFKKLYPVGNDIEETISERAEYYVKVHKKDETKEPTK